MEKKNIFYTPVERCVFCGTEIPEGRQVCFVCEHEYSPMKVNGGALYNYPDISLKRSRKALNDYDCKEDFDETIV